MSHSSAHMSNPSGLWYRISGPPTAQEAVLALLLERADDRLTEPQVRAELGLPRSTVSVALKALADDGIINSTRVGRSGLYSASTRNPLVRQLKIARAVFRAQLALEPVLGLAELAVMFGSASRGEDHSDSDIDVLVVTRDVEAVRHALAAHPRVQGVVITPEEHMAMIAEKTTFATETARGITLQGA